jgi:CspA family cold shock protein
VSTKKISGTIRRLTDKGFGFIRGEDGLDYFFHNTELIDCTFAQLHDGDEMKFMPVQMPKGLRANEVERTREHPLG